MVFVKWFVVIGILVASGITAPPAHATGGNCGGLYLSSTSCTLPQGVTQYAIEIAGGSGGDGEGISNGSSGDGVGGYGALEVVNATKEIEQKLIFIGIGGRGQDGKDALLRTILNGGAALAGSSGGYGWLARRDSDGGRGSGSGGGASDLRTVQDNPATRFLVAGAGGGGGASADSRNGGKGGHANQNGGGGATVSNVWFINSNPLGLGEDGYACTNGGFGEGGAGGGGGAGRESGSGGGGGAGCANGGTSGTGGPVGQNGGNVSNNGFSWLGGLSSLSGSGANAPQDTVGFAGGGGGGGYFGGGSGGSGGVASGGYAGGGGGGGGSSFIPAGATLVSSGWNTGNGFAQISSISSPMPDSSYAVGQNFSHQVTVSGFKKSAADTSLAVTYSMSGAPAGLTISSSSGAISGTVNETGSFNVRVTASAEWSAGNTISSIQQFTLNIAQIEQISNIAKKEQSSKLPIKSAMKKRSSTTFTLSQLKTTQNQDILISVQGACSLKATYKNVKTKVGKKTKYVKTLSGYKITMGKKAKRTCTVVETAGATSSLQAFSKSTVISIK